MYVHTAGLWSPINGMIVRTESTQSEVKLYTVMESTQSVVKLFTLIHDGSVPGASAEATDAPSSAVGGSAPATFFLMDSWRTQAATLEAINVRAQNRRKLELYSNGTTNY
jgi:hypothetical protein